MFFSVCFLVCFGFLDRFLGRSRRSRRANFGPIPVRSFVFVSRPRSKEGACGSAEGLSFPSVRAARPSANAPQLQMCNDSSCTFDRMAQRLNASSPLDSLLMERKVARQSGRALYVLEDEHSRSSSPVDTLLLERRVALQQRPNAGRAAFLPVAHSGLLGASPAILPLLRQRLQRIIEQQQQQQQQETVVRPVADRAVAASQELASLEPPSASVSPATSSPTAGLDRPASSPVDSLLLERKVLRQQRKRSEVDECSKEDVGNCLPGLWLSGDFALDDLNDEASSDGSHKHGSPLSPCAPPSPWALPRKQPRNMLPTSHGA